MKTTWIMLLAILSAGVLGGCAAHTMDIPAGFVAVDSGAANEFTVRAVAADGAVIGLRTKPNPKNGSLAFWSEAIRNELVSSQGYKLEKEEAIQCAAGEKGDLLTFSQQRSGVPFLYILGIFVQGDTILLAEAGGKADTVTPKLQTILAAIHSAR